MQLNVLNKDLNKIAVIDNFESLIWCKRYNQVGALDLQIAATDENIANLKSGHYLTRDDDDSVFKIEAIEINTADGKDNSLIVGGHEIKKILQQRVVYETRMYDTTVEDVIRNLIETNIINPSNPDRKISNFNLNGKKGLEDRVKLQITYDNVGEKIEALCKTYGYGYKVMLDDKNFYFDLFKGTDRTVSQFNVPQVVFSPSYENVISSKYNLDASEFKNTALVGGEGEGTARVKTEIGMASGLDRYEMFIDAKSISSNADGTTGDSYFQALTEYGKEQLSQNTEITSFEGVVDTSLYEYKKEFDLGDIVTIANEFGIMADARITEVIETWDKEGYTFEPKFEFYEPNLILANEEGASGISGYLYTEAGMTMYTDRNQVLLTEDAPPTELGVKISNLENTTTLHDGCCLPVVQDKTTKKVSFETLKDYTRATFEIDENGHLIATYI